MNRKGFRHSERGSLTVYAAVVLVPLLLFQFVLLDFVRIKMAEADEEAAIRSAARSVLAAYDPTLREYGLFGLLADGGTMAEIASFVIEQQGSPADDADTFSLLRRNPEQVTVESLYTLADHSIFRRQMLEEMKLKAPIEFTRHLYQHWQGKAEEIEAIEQELELAEEAEDLLQKRDRALRAAFNEATRLDQLIRSAASRFQHIPGPIEGSGDEPPNPMAVMARQAQLDALRSDGMQRFAQMQRRLESLREELRKAEESDRKLAELIAEYEADNDEGLMQGIELFGSRYFTDYEQGAARPVSMFGAFVQRISYGVDPEVMSELNRAYRDAFDDWYARMRADEERRKAAFDELERRKKEKRKEVETQMDETSEEISEHVCGAGEEALYGRLLDHEDKYIRHNEAASGWKPNPAEDLDLKADDYQRSSLGLLTDAARILEKIRDEVYVNEYVMYYFNYRTLETEADGGSPYENAKDHALSGQEAEYVLYGLSSCTLNRAAAYAEIYAVRFAVRLVEALLDVKKQAVGAVGTPLLVFLTAAAEAAVKAHQDMKQLIRGEAVPVFAKTPALKMAYADYLRLFLAVHSKETEKMARIQALIELNTGIDLTERPAYIILRSESAIRLWFLPGAAEWVRRAAGLQGRIEDRRYIISKRAEMAY